MFSFVEEAWAMAPPPGAEVGPMDTFMSFAPLVLLMLIFYFFVIRPQNRKQEEQKLMLKNLEEGDRVQTVGGLYGTIVKLKDEEITVEVAKDVKVKINRNFIHSKVAKSG